jgi:hypothetical protein
MTYTFRSLALLAFLFFYTLLAAQQPDSIYTYRALNRSLAFAQLTYGGDLLVLSGGESGDGTFGPTVMPRATIGGLHFWGHADFYVTFPLGIRLQQKPAFATRLEYRESVETGFKIYPWALRPGTVRPFVGMSFQPFSFGYARRGVDTGEGFARSERWISPVQMGLTYTSKRWLFLVGARYNWRQPRDYAVTPTEWQPVRVRAWNFNVGLIRYIDTDRGMGRPRTVGRLNDLHRLLEAAGKLSDWYMGIGPSTALQMSRSSFLTQKYPYLAADQLNSFLVPDATVGYYFQKPDINVGLTTRVMGFRTRAFEADLRMLRATLGVEGYKFLFNYHGFVPFVGPMLSMEYLQLRENGTRTASRLRPAAGIVFGWDIRVTQTGSSLLRTNLRYTPGLHLDVDGQRLEFNHLEFNFIQMVRYIGRTKVYRKG